MKSTRTYLLGIVLLLLGISAQSQTLDSSKTKFYVPSHARIQYAGNVGFISMSSGWSLIDERMEFTLGMGYVPEFISEIPIYIASSKLMYTPIRWELPLGKQLSLKPLSVGFTWSYYFGERFNKYQDNSQYPSGYYWWNVPVRNAFNYHVELQYRLKSKPIKRISFYLEASYWDLYLFSQVANENSDQISVWDAMTLGFGTKLYFRD